MRAITKGREPVSLTSHRENRPSDYDSYPEKDDLRQALVTEQRGLCCYCMSRIRPALDSMKIEHWRSQSRCPGRQLNYRNLLGACLGGHRKPAHLQHCDTRKGNKDLKWNPADLRHHIETRVRYGPDGSIHADEADFDGQLNDVLNLNLPVLKNNRKAVYDTVLQWWGRQKRGHQGRVPRELLERERTRHDAGVGELAPYVQVAVWLLGQKLAVMRGMSQGRHSEAAFETVIEAHLLQNGYISVASDGFDRERAIFPDTVLAFIRETQPKEWAKLEALHGDKTGEQILGDLCKWMDIHGVPRDATPRLQVLRENASHRLLQGGARTEPGTQWRATPPTVWG